MTEIKKAVVSGILISIGGCVLIASTKSGMMWAGAVLFSLGLFAICEYGFNLYTGKVGYIAEHFRDVKYIGLVVLILVVNLLTTFLMGILVSLCLPDIAEGARASYAAKLGAEPQKWLLSSVLCGLRLTSGSAVRRSACSCVFRCSFSADSTTPSRTPFIMALPSAQTHSRCAMWLS